MSTWKDTIFWIFPCHILVCVLVRTAATWYVGIGRLCLNRYHTGSEEVVSGRGEE